MKSRGFLKLLGGLGAVASMIGTGVGIGRLTLEPDDSILKDLQNENKSLNVKLTENDHQSNKLDLSNSDLLAQLEEARKIHKFQRAQKDKEIAKLKDQVNKAGKEPKTRSLKASIDKLEERNIPWYIEVFDRGRGDDQEKWCTLDFDKRFKDSFESVDVDYCNKAIDAMTPYWPIVKK